jgi:hypothetical protein
MKVAGRVHCPLIAAKYRVKKEQSQKKKTQFSLGRLKKKIMNRTLCPEKDLSQT